MYVITYEELFVFPNFKAKDPKNNNSNIDSIPHIVLTFIRNFALKNAKIKKNRSANVHFINEIGIKCYTQLPPHIDILTQHTAFNTYIFIFHIQLSLLAVSVTIFA